MIGLRIKLKVSVTPYMAIYGASYQTCSYRLAAWRVDNGLACTFLWCSILLAMPCVIYTFSTIMDDYGAGSVHDMSCSEVK